MSKILDGDFVNNFDWNKETRRYLKIWYGSTEFMYVCMYMCVCVRACVYVCVFMYGIYC